MKLPYMDWMQFRDQFPTTKTWAYFDHAAVAPLSGPCVSAIADYTADLAVNGVRSFRRWESRIEEVRRIAGHLLNSDPLDVAFVQNTTAGIGLIAEGFPWQPGDNVITVAEEYPSNQYPWMNLRDRGVEARSVPSRNNRVAIEDLRDAMDGRTRLLAISAVEFASGYRNDLAALGELCRSKDVFFFVDAIQALGVLPIDVRDLLIDAMSADGHKWMLGPEGAGIFYVRREWIDRLHTLGVGWNSVVGAHDFGKIDFRLKPHAGRWEGGSANVAGITGLGASLQLLLDVGIPAIAERVMALTEYLAEAAPATGWQVFSSRLPGEKSSIVSLVKDGASPWEIKKRCEQNGIVVNVRAGRLRISPHAYNSFEEIDRLIDLLCE
jgi:cysteine desulfurase/selenocysteine lyase